MSEHELLHEILHRLGKVEELLGEINEVVNPLQVVIVPLVESNNMTIASTPLPSSIDINDDENVTLGLALLGSNPDNLTIASAVWSSDTDDVVITQTAPAQTATATATPGTDGTANVIAVVTMSDQSTLTSPPFAVVVGATPIPLSVAIVAGTPTVNA